MFVLGSLLLLFAISSYLMSAEFKFLFIGFPRIMFPKFKGFLFG